MMHHQDFDLLASALAAEHREALDSGSRRAVVQVERIALGIADAIAREYRAFDPAKFMLSACEAGEIRQLAAPVARQFVDRFGTSDYRPRLNGQRARGLKPDEQISTRYWKEDSLVDSVLKDVSDSVGAMAAASALMAYGRVTTLGQLAAMSDDELREIPGLRLGPFTLGAIHKVQELWRAKRVPEAHRAEPGALAERPAQVLSRAAETEVVRIGRAVEIAWNLGTRDRHASSMSGRYPGSAEGRARLAADLGLPGGQHDPAAQHAIDAYWDAYDLAGRMLGDPDGAGARYLGYLEGQQVVTALGRTGVLTGESESRGALYVQFADGPAVPVPRSVITGSLTHLCESEQDAHALVQSRPDLVAEGDKLLVPSQNQVFVCTAGELVASAGGAAGQGVPPSAATGPGLAAIVTDAFPHPAGAALIKAGRQPQRQRQPSSETTRPQSL